MTFKRGGILLARNNSNILFNSIAPVYGLFYKAQKNGLLRS
jgi:hypothetical protein